MVKQREQDIIKYLLIMKNRTKFTPVISIK